MLYANHQASRSDGGRLAHKRNVYGRDAVFRLSVHQPLPELAQRCSARLPPARATGENYRRVCRCDYPRHRAGWPRYILSPGFALPHARPEAGVLSKNSALSLLCCSEAVDFPDHPGIRLIVILAAADSEQHIQTIQRLVCWLDEGERLQRFSAVQSQTEFAALLASH